MTGEERTRSRVVTTADLPGEVRRVAAGPVRREGLHRRTRVHHGQLTTVETSSAT